MQTIYLRHTPKLFTCNKTAGNMVIKALPRGRGGPTIFRRLEPDLDLNLSPTVSVLVADFWVVVLQLGADPGSHKGR